MSKPKEDNRDIFQKALDEENTYPALGAIYGAALGGLLGEYAYKLLRNKHIKKIHSYTPATIIGVWAGGNAGLEAGKKALDYKRSTDRRK